MRLILIHHHCSISIDYELRKSLDLWHAFSGLGMPQGDRYLNIIIQCNSCMSQITTIKTPKQDYVSYLVGSEAKNPLPSKTTGFYLCPICDSDLSPYSRCFDCKRIIQLICYKCQWESNLIDHNECHKNVSVISSRTPNFQKRSYTVFDELNNKIDDLYHMPFQVVAPVLNLVH